MFIHIREERFSSLFHGVGQQPFAVFELAALAAAPSADPEAGEPTADRPVLDDLERLRPESEWSNLSFTAWL